VHVMCIPRDAFVHPKKKAQKHTDRKATFCASRKNLFSKREEISEGPHTQFLVIS